LKRNDAPDHGSCGNDKKKIRPPRRNGRPAVNFWKEIKVSTDPLTDSQSATYMKARKTCCRITLVNLLVNQNEIGK